MGKGREETRNEPRKLTEMLVAITGASGVDLAIKLLETLMEKKIDVELV
ncbi:hypothetical protein LCGC14_1744600, partial [marine sediment metagenome]